MFRAEFDEPPLSVAKLGRAEAFRAFRGDDQSAPGFKDVERRDHTLDSLVVSLVERVAGRRRHHGLKLAWHRNLRRAADEVDGRLVAFCDLTKAHIDEISILVDHRVERVDISDL